MGAGELIGAENAGFKGIMANFNLEYGIAARSWQPHGHRSGALYRRAQDFRQVPARTSGGPPRLADMAMRRAHEAHDTTIWKVRQGERCIPKLPC